MRWTAAFVFLVLAAFPARAQEASMIPVTIDGQTVRLEIRIYKPPGNKRFPTIVFNHGSTGRGDNPSLFTRSLYFREAAQFFVARGWAFVLPMRRGRGNSEGRYDEGFNAMRSAYTCETATSLAGADRALRDVEAAMTAILAMPFVDRSRVVMGGWSRGGILSLAYAGMNPQQVKGVVNFVGGWMGMGCPTASTINQTLFKRGARFQGATIWLYGDKDPFYPLAHSRENFATFLSAGGRGDFVEFPPPPGRDGHMIPAHPEIWAARVEQYLASLALAAPPARKR